MYSYNFVTLADISSPNSFKPLDALCSMPKHVHGIPIPLAAQELPDHGCVLAEDEGVEPVVRSSRLSIRNPSVSINFSREGVAMVGTHNLMSSAAMLNAICNTMSFWCFVACARASHTVGGVFCICHLHQFKQVSEVHDEVIFRALILFLIPNLLVLKPRLPQIHYYLSDHFRDTGPCRAVDAGVEAR